MHIVCGGSTRTVLDVLILSAGDVPQTGDDGLRVGVLSEALSAANLAPGACVVTVDTWLEGDDFEMWGDVSPMVHSA